MFLEVLGDLEQARGPGLYLVSFVLNHAWETRLREPYERRREEAKMAREAYRANLRGKAAAGDADAKEDLHLEAHMDLLAQSIMRNSRRRGRHRVRKGIGMEDIKPTRCFALLERRGLVQRAAWVPGPGARIGLTDAGRQVLGMSPAPKPENRDEERVPLVPLVPLASSGRPNGTAAPA
jgi:hypothetical protein